VGLPAHVIPYGTTSGSSGSSSGITMTDATAGGGTCM
jgi:hypothetical protein